MTSTYRITGWYRDHHEEESFITFDADSDDAAWSYELPPRFLSYKLEKFDGEGWNKLELGREAFAAALKGIVEGIVPPKTKGKRLAKPSNIA